MRGWQKINASTTGKRDEIDLWGYESKPTLKERQEEFVRDKAVLNDASSILLKLNEKEKFKVSEFNQDERIHIISILLKAITVVSNYIRRLREIVVQREATKVRLKSSQEGDWRKSKYVFVISAIITHLYDIRSCIRNLLGSIDEIGQLISELNGSSFVKVGVVNMKSQTNYLHLRDNEIDILNDDQFRYVKQRSPTWHAIRQTAVVTGSTLNDALGLSSLKSQQEHFDHVIYKKPKSEPPAAVKERMSYGTENEKHAIATLVGKVLPVYSPALIYMEEGCYRLCIGDRNIVISPDGSCRTSVNDVASYGVECKCPFPGKIFTTPVFYKLPKYYVTQVLSEMYALKTNKLFFICYSEESITVQRVTFDEDLWNDIQQEVHYVYGNDRPLRPTKRSELSKRIQTKINEFVENNVEFLAEMTSLKASDCEHSNTSGENEKFCSHKSEHKTGMLTVRETMECLHNCDKHIENAYKLTKAKACEFLGFMISNLDREYKTEQLHSIPIAYGLKGYSMSTDTLRSMIEDVLRHCKERGLYVPVVSFDGQWCRLSVRDHDGAPLTVLQLQKTIFAAVRRISKTALIKIMSESNVISLRKDANLNDIKDIVDTEVTDHHSQIIVGSLKSEKPLFVSKNAYDLIRKKTVIPTNESHIECVRGNTDNISSLPDNVIDNLSTELAEDIESTATLANQAANIVIGAIEEINLSETIFSHDCANGTDTDMLENNKHEQGCVVNTALETNANILDEMDVDNMLSALKESANAKGKWNISLLQFKEKLTSANMIDKSFTLRDIQICLKPIIGKLKSKEIKVQLSGPKCLIVNTLSNLLGDGTTKEIRCKATAEKVKTLKTLSKQAVMKISKDHLNVIVAENIFPQELSQWYNMSPFGKKLNIKDVDTTDQKYWYSRPEFNAPLDYYIFMILDAYHQICGLRRLVCANGIPSASISRKGWQQVAEESESNGSGLNRSLVNDLIDRQSIGFAVKTFSEEVEDALHNSGYVHEAEFCQLVRQWYQAEDEPGISSKDRCEARLRFRAWLLHNVNFGKFPPYGYI